MKFQSNADWINFAIEQTHNDKTVMDAALPSNTRPALAPDTGWPRSTHFGNHRACN